MLQHVCCCVETLCIIAEPNNTRSVDARLDVVFECTLDRYLRARENAMTLRQLHPCIIVIYVLFIWIGKYPLPKTVVAVHAAPATPTMVDISSDSLLCERSQMKPAIDKFLQCSWTASDILSSAIAFLWEDHDWSALCCGPFMHLNMFLLARRRVLCALHVKA